MPTREAQKMTDAEQRLFKPGDLWRDSDGDLWFVVKLADGGLNMYCATEGYGRPAIIEAVHGPLALVRREDSTA